MMEGEGEGLHAAETEMGGPGDDTGDSVTFRPALARAGGAAAQAESAETALQARADVFV